MADEITTQLEGIKSTKSRASNVKDVYHELLIEWKEYFPSSCGNLPSPKSLAHELKVNQKEIQSLTLQVQDLNHRLEMASQGVGSEEKMRALSIASKLERRRWKEEKETLIREQNALREEINGLLLLVRTSEEERRREREGRIGQGREDSRTDINKQQTPFDVSPNPFTSNESLMPASSPIPFPSPRPTAVSCSCPSSPDSVFPSPQNEKSGEVRLLDVNDEKDSKSRDTSERRKESEDREKVMDKGRDRGRENTHPDRGTDGRAKTNPRGKRVPVSPRMSEWEGGERRKDGSPMGDEERVYLYSRIRSLEALLDQMRRAILLDVQTCGRESERGGEREIITGPSPPSSQPNFHQPSPVYDLQDSLSLNRAIHRKIKLKNTISVKSH